MTDDDDREGLIEQVVSAWRPSDRDGGPVAHPAWHDLDEGGRREAFARTQQARVMEAALDPEGFTTTARAVLARLGVR